MCWVKINKKKTTLNNSISRYTTIIMHGKLNFEKKNKVEKSE